MDYKKTTLVLLLCFISMIGTVAAFENQNELDFPNMEDRILPHEENPETLINMPPADPMNPVQSQEQNKTNETYKKGQLIVKFKKNVEINVNKKQAGLQSNGFSAFSIEEKENINSLNSLNQKQTNSMNILFEKQKEEDTPLSNIFIISVDENTDIVALAKEYENNPLVEYAEPNYEVQAFETIPNDIDYSKQWSHQNTNSEQAWDIQRGSSDVIIAVIDTGVDYNHVELSSKIWNNTDEIVGNGIDDDNNGYIDDIRGWDFHYGDNDPKDGHGHGTHCSGIAAANTNNSIGVAGVCWDCTIMPVQGLSSSGSGYWDRLALAIQYAANNSADIISMSLGGSMPSDLVKDALSFAESKGVVVIAAAGNTYRDTKHYPAGYDNVIAVTASTIKDEKAYFSTYGYWT
ncbi:MAG: S8 family serine peptidase, partial [Candidatus Aenigmarchaeota archaeon]|nr:S8 family serine peptidase [Candidatus Aenigmarchaeota archaeon]